MTYKGKGFPRRFVTKRGGGREGHTTNKDKRTRFKTGKVPNSGGLGKICTFATLEKKQKRKGPLESKRVSLWGEIGGGEKKLARRWWVWSVYGAKCEKNKKTSAPP